MRQRPCTQRAAVAVALAVVLLAPGCNSGEREPEADASSGDEAIAPAISVTIPAERLTPFCQAMIDLSDELRDDPPDDVRARIVEVYESVVDVVPPEIRDDFVTVLARLRAGEPAATVATAAPYVTSVVRGSVDPTDTTNPLVDEGYSPDEDPTTRLSEYVRFACRDSVNNPGPEATEPPVPATT